MRPEITYSGHHFQLPRDFLRDATHLNPWRSLLGLALTWAAILALWGLLRFAIPASYFWYFYLPLIFLIAGRQGALLQLVHEGAHGLLHPDKNKNRALLKWFCSLPVGVFPEGYTRAHMKHHAYTNTLKDPASDREKYRVTDMRNPFLYFLFLKDLSGWTALSIFFAYQEAQESGSQRKDDNRPRFSSFLELCLVQLVILGLGFQFQIKDYILLWLVPAISPHMFLMRVRGIAEHGLISQLGKVAELPSQGTFYTRSFLTTANRYSFRPLIWIEKMLIGSFEVYYHHEHHLFPTVPFYHLQKIHQRIRFQVQSENPDVYAKGYFAAALRSLLKPETKHVTTLVET